MKTSFFLILSFTSAFAGCGHEQTEQMKVDCGAFLSQRREVMDTYDKNRDGELDREEWKVMESLVESKIKEIDKSLNSKSDPEQLRVIFNEMDANGDNKITFRELTMGLCDPEVEDP